MNKKKSMKDWVIHYGDSGEPNSSLGEARGIDEQEALRNFSKDFNIVISPALSTVSEIKDELYRHSIYVGDVYEE